MDEMYRMLGKAHEADLERDAQKWQRAKETRRQPHAPAAAPNTGVLRGKSRWPSRARILAFVTREARAGG